MSGIIAGIVGYLSGLITPWVKWKIEKRRDRHHARKQLVMAWRTAIEAEEHDMLDSRSKFAESASYSSLRVHLSQEVLKKVEDRYTFYATGPRGDRVRLQMLLDEISHLERKWKLV